MNILMTGGTGFIGSGLKALLLSEEHSLKIITRSPASYNNKKSKNLTFISSDSNWEKPIEWADAVINLAGASIFGQRWSKKVKEEIYSSRIDTTTKLVDAVKNVNQPPDVMISGSAVGYYGNREDKVINENEPPGNDFLAKVCLDWEKAAEPVKNYGVRLIISRTGIVLEKDGGVLKSMLPVFKSFIGGPIGSGTQYIPWIHRHDLCRAFLFLMTHENYNGPFNVCAPHAVTMNYFAQSLADVLNRPAFFRVPEWALNLVLGEAAKPITESIRARPKRLKEIDFNFKYEYPREALVEII